MTGGGSGKLFLETPLSLPAMGLCFDSRVFATHNVFIASCLHLYLEYYGKINLLEKASVQELLNTACKHVASPGAGWHFLFKRKNY